MNAIINLQQLSEQISALTGASNSTAELFIKELFATISDALSKGESVSIKGLGTFRVSEYPENTVLFAPDNDLAESINLPFSCFEAVELQDDIDFENNIEDMSSSEIEINSTLNNVEEDSAENNQSISESEVVNTNIDSTNEELITEEGSQEVEQNYPEEHIENDISDEDSIDETADIDTPSAEDFANQNTNESTCESGGSKRRIWYIAMLLLGLIIGYVIGTIYPYQKFVEAITTTQPSQNVVVSDSVFSSKQDSVQAIAIDSLITDTISISDTQPQITDTVSTNRFLTTMSRKYFGEMIFWVYIYEENKEILGNPNRIRPGTIVKIPSAEKYNINRNDSASLAIAKLKAMEIYAPYEK